jgi:hypothetical protein
MPTKRDKLTIDMKETVENLRESKGLGIDAFFSPPPASALTEQQKHANNDRGVESVDSGNQNEQVLPVKKEVTPLVQTPGKPNTQTTEAKETSGFLDFPKDKPVKKKQVSVWLTPEQIKTLKQLYFKFNNNDSPIDKSTLIGIGIETVSQLLDGQTHRLTTIQRIKDFIKSRLEKPKNT